jgi:hypothetical protein
MVLSGYLVTRSVQNTDLTNNRLFCAYLGGRWLRFIVVLVPALLLGVFWDNLSIMVAGKIGTHTNLPSALGGFDIATRLNVHIFLGNLFFLQDILVPSFGSNSPLWTVCPLFWSSMGFVVICWAVFGKKSILTRIMVAGSFVLFLLLFGKVVGYFIAIWLCGSFVAFFDGKINRQIKTGEFFVLFHLYFVY